MSAPQMRSGNSSDVPLCNSQLLVYQTVPNKTLNVTANSTSNVTSEIGWFEVVVPAICLLGIIGNVLNLLVLTRRRMLSGMDRLEKSANYGLVALAFSDLMFCLLVFPHTFIHSHVNTSTESHVYRLYYRVYGTSAINLFLMISTWLIVCMAVNRFIVVVYPFKARQVLGNRYTIGSIVGVYLFALIATMPFFLRMMIGACIDEYGDRKYKFMPRWDEVTHHHRLRIYVMWVWPIVADFIPVVVLALCNSRLIRELRAADTARRRLGQGQQSRDSSQKVTLTLVVIVLMLLFLASPAEILRYTNPYKHFGSVGMTLANIANVMQLLNFALNFVLYCVVNPVFRKEIQAMFACCAPKVKSNRCFLTTTTECTV